MTITTPDLETFVSEHKLPETVRHNTLGHRWPKAAVQDGSRPTCLGGSTNHDLVIDTVQKASTIGLERAGKLLMEARSRENDRLEHSAVRFKKSREVSQLWHNLQDVFDEARGIKTKYPEGWSDDYAERPPWHQRPPQAPVGASKRASRASGAAVAQSQPPAAAGAAKRGSRASGKSAVPGSASRHASRTAKYRMSSSRPCSRGAA